MKKLIFSFLAALAFSCAASAATKVIVSCDLPTTRTDGTPFAASEVGSILFDWAQPGQLGLGPFTQSSCSYTVAIAKGACIKKGTVFTARIVDNQPTPLTSAPGSITLAEDACNPLAPPSAPTVRVTVE